MSLLDFDTDPQIQVLRQQNLRAANALGMPVNNLVTANAPSTNQVDASVSLINGRISRQSSNQQAMWMTLGFEVNATLYTDTGSLYGDLQNGDVVVDDAGIKYRVVGRSRAIQKGSLPSFFAYPLKAEQTV